MRKWLAGMTAVIALFSTVYAYANAELDARIQNADRVLKEIMASPDQSVPEEMIAKAKAIAIYPNVIKGSFIFGARWGRGIVVSRDARTGEWGPVAFSTLGGGSWGLQIGGQATDLILIVLNDRGMNGLLSNNFKLGTDASVAAGPVGRATEIGTDLSLSAGLLSYSRNKGLFAGVALDGAVLTQDNNSNSAYYGKSIGSKEILLGHEVGIQPSSQDLIRSLTEYSKRWSARVKSEQVK